MIPRGIPSFEHEDVAVAVAGQVEAARPEVEVHCAVEYAGDVEVTDPVHSDAVAYA